jgi:lysophospholipase L1-like esterase
MHCNERIEKQPENRGSGRMKFSRFQLERLREIALCATLGVSLLQALACQADDPEQRWEADIQKFEEQDRQTPPVENPILFVGSSSIRLWDLKKSFPDLPAINRGFGGSQISDVLEYTDRIVLKYKPKQIVFYAGDNDLASGKTAGTVAEDFAKFASRVHAALPETPIVFITIKPSRARWKLWDEAQSANRRIKVQAEFDKLLTVLDIAPLILGDDGEPNLELFRDDKLHLNEKGYERLTEALKPLLAEKPKS